MARPSQPCDGGERPLLADAPLLASRNVLRELSAAESEIAELCYDRAIGIALERLGGRACALSACAHILHACVLPAHFV